MNDLFDSYDSIDKPSERRVYTVSELTRGIRSFLENQYPYIWIEGEISNLKLHSSGHLYFSLKDQEAQLSCVMWRGRNLGMLFRPEDGMKVLVSGNLTVYERMGRYQLDVSFMQPAGLGELQLAFERLKKRLQAEGLFDQEHKKPLPLFPRTVGVVTSLTGAAIRDIESIIHRRFPGIEIIIYPVRVQGKGAAEEIAQAIADFNKQGQADVLIVGRGGGSLEDLWAFNEEVVARAIFDSKIPIVSAVGHEIDFSISDFVADVRAPTPSAAAELVVRDRQEIRSRIVQNGMRLWRTVLRLIQINRQRLDGLERSFAFRQPWNLVREYRMRLDDVQRHLESVQKNRIENQKQNLSHLSARLTALDPRGVLKRGYSITTRTENGEVITRSAQTEVHESLRIQLAEGALQILVDQVEEDVNFEFIEEK